MKVTDGYKFYQKLNANCKEEEKTGSGPGSCGGSKGSEGKIDRSTTMIKNKFEKIQKIPDAGTRRDELRNLSQKLRSQERKAPLPAEKKSLLNDIESHATYAGNDYDRESTAQYNLRMEEKHSQMLKDKEIMAPKEFFDRYRNELMNSNDPTAEIKFPNVAGKPQFLRIGDKITFKDEGFWGMHDQSSSDGTVSGRLYAFNPIKVEDGVGISVEVGNGSESNIPMSRIIKVEKLDPSMAYDSFRRETYNIKQREAAIKKYRMNYR